MCITRIRNKKASVMLAFNFSLRSLIIYCNYMDYRYMPDHRDKIPGQKLLQCQLQKLRLLVTLIKLFFSYCLLLFLIYLPKFIQCKLKFPYLLYPKLLIPPRGGVFKSMFFVKFSTFRVNVCLKSMKNVYNINLCCTTTQK